MFAADIDIKKLPISFLFDRVAHCCEGKEGGGGRKEIEELVAYYVLHDHFLNNREVIRTINNRFDEVEGDLAKKNWTLFFFSVLNRKDYKSLLQMNESIEEFRDKIKAYPELNKSSKYFEALKGLKKEEYFAETLTSAFTSADIQTVKKATLIHSWFCTTLQFLTCLEKIKFNPNISASLITLSQVDPMLIHKPKLCKIIHNLAVKEEDQERRDALLNWIHTSSKSLSPRKYKPKPDFDRSFDEVMEKSKLGDNFEEAVDLFSDDLLNHGFKLFIKVPLSEYTRLKWTKKGEAPHLSKIFDFFNKLEAFVKNKIINIKSTSSKARVMEFFINLAEKSMLKRDFNSAWAIISALESSDVSKEHKALARLFHINPQIQIKKQKLFEDFGVFKNFMGLRHLMDSHLIMEQSLVPFMGLFTKDLTFIHEGNPDMKGDELNQDKAQLLGETLLKIHNIRHLVPLCSDAKTNFIQEIKDKKLKD